MQKLKLLGKGGYGKVYEICYQGKKRALKCLDYSHGLDCPWEVEILFRRLPGCIHGIKKLFWDGGLAILLPLAEGDLRTVSQDLDLVDIIKQICVNLCNLHAAGYYHLDLKLDNVLIYKKKALLADFSISRPRNTILGNQTSTTPNFRAPELFFPSKDFVLNDKADSWSLGILILELFTGYRPEGLDDNSILEEITCFLPKKRKSLIARLPSELRLLTKGLLELDSKKRLSLSDHFCVSTLNVERKVRFFTFLDVRKYYSFVVDVVKNSGGKWKTCLNAITLINNYYLEKGKVSTTICLCCIKLSYQLMEDTLLSYNYFSIWNREEKNFIDTELSIVLSLSTLYPKILCSPYPHLVLEQLNRQI